MKYVGFYGGLFIYFSIVSIVASDLGLTAPAYVFPDVVGIEEPEGVEAFLIAINTVFNYASAFLQLATLQAPIPQTLSIFLVSALALPAVIGFILIVRGV